MALRSHKCSSFIVKMDRGIYFLNRVIRLREIIHITCSSDLGDVLWIKNTIGTFLFQPFIVVALLAFLNRLSTN